MGIIVHRDGDHTIIRVAKSRYHEEIGVPGDVRAQFNKHDNHFEIVREA